MDVREAEVAAPEQGRWRQDARNRSDSSGVEREGLRLEESSVVYWNKCSCEDVRVYVVDFTVGVHRATSMDFIWVFLATSLCATPLALFVPVDFERRWTTRTNNA